LSYLLEKSQANLVAAQVLHEKGIYSTVPHCAYYSCLQRMKYELCVQFGVFCDDEGRELKGKSTHALIRDRFMQACSDKIDALSTTEQRTLYVSYTELKTYRNKLDYHHAV
jgi:hypothetical protein